MTSECGRRAVDVATESRLRRARTRRSVGGSSKPSTTTLILFLATVLLTLGLTACGSEATGGLFKTTCSDVGKRPSNLEESNPKQVIVLLDVTSNDTNTASRISDDTAAVLDTMLSTHDDLMVTGFTAGGTDESIRKIDCMDGNEYFFGGGNERRQESEREDLKNYFAKAMEDAVKNTTVASTGDARVLLRKVKTVATAPSAQVILWSSFLEQGSDCLAFEETDHPAAELANSVAQRCADQGLLPDLAGADLTVVGAGSSADRPDLGPFGKQLAGALCARMTVNCDIR